MYKFVVYIKKNGDLHIYNNAKSIEFAMGLSGEDVECYLVDDDNSTNTIKQNIINGGYRDED